MREALRVLMSFLTPPDDINRLGNCVGLIKWLSGIVVGRMGARARRGGGVGELICEIEPGLPACKGDTVDAGVNVRSGLEPN